MQEPDKWRKIIFLPRTCVCLAMIPPPPRPVISDSPEAVHVHVDELHEVPCL